MQRTIMLVLTALVLLVLLAYTVTYQVRFTEAAVLTTFGHAGEGAVKSDPGLRFKWPYPIQAVTSYDTRLRFADVRLETQQTADSRQIIVQGFCVWQVEDPLKFFQSFSNAGPRADDHYRKAESTVQSTLRSALGAVSRYRMNELFGAGEQGSKIPQLEGEVLQALRSQGAAGAQPTTAQASLASVGVRVVDAGVVRIELPTETTSKVFERMVANRDRLAQELTSKGESEASAIRSRAEADAKRIEAFAKARADEIRTLGDTEAREFYEKMNANPELAVFLRNIEFLREAFGKRVTLVLPTSQPGLGLLKPDALEGLAPGQIPSLKVPAASPTGKETGGKP